MVTEELLEKTKKKLDAYNVVWNSQSKNSAGSMPIGNGDITANVWAEADGTVSFYVGKTDTWSEATRLLKLGKVNVQIFPNPFREQSAFCQTLRLRESEILIRSQQEKNSVTLRIWVDANYPVIRMEAEGHEDFEIQVTSQVWRKNPQEIWEEKEPQQANNWNFFHSPMAVPAESADVLLEKDDGIGWYHRNEISPYQEMLYWQNAGEFYREEEEPYKNRTFGACIKGKELLKENPTTLRGKGRKSYACSIYAHTAMTDSAEAWEHELWRVMEADEQDMEQARRRHLAWWEAFWNRSWVFISGDKDAETVTRGYLLQRYMQAIEGRGAYPIKFNGGTLTFDYQGENADHRDWGAPYWFQNTRLLYWNMLASGDFDMMLPFFSMYHKALPLQQKITGKYYNHEGAFFPETTNFFGAYPLLDFYWNDLSKHMEPEPRNNYVKYYWQGGLELSAMMLEYYEYTGEKDFLREIAIPFAEQIVYFYDCHFKRGIEGYMKITPTHALETYWDGVCNPAEQIAGLRAVIGKLLSVDSGKKDLPDLTTKDQRARWERIYKSLPKIPVGSVNGKRCIKAAEEYGTNRYNMENPELYPVFPYKLYGVGKEELETAVNTYWNKQSTFCFCWSQNGIHAAYLGLTEEAKAAVISHFSNTEESVRFPAFWAKGNDWMPDLDNGGSAMSAVQAMLLQWDGKEPIVLPAWPREWSVECKLHGPEQRVVYIEYETGREVKVEVQEKEAYRKEEHYE